MTPLHPLLEPYAPTSTDPFDAVKAAHLYNRAGFGATPQEVAHAVKLGPAAAADALLSFPDREVDEQSTDAPNLAAIKSYPRRFNHLRMFLEGKTRQQRREFRQQFQMANRQAIEQIGHWWLGRMVSGPYPLQEKLVLFWHGHFTSNARDVRDALYMWKQNQLLRRMAAGHFGRFVAAISRDAAMLEYLDNQQNRKRHPNENYARELLELFTLGIGNYSEQDVKEAARAFSGWRHDGGEFAFRRSDHDSGPKTFLGRKGAFDGQDIIDITLEQPACARFVASKIFRFLAYDEVDEDLSKSLGNVLREANYELRPLLRVIVKSRAFYSSRAIGGQIKSPIQLMAGTARLLEASVPADSRTMALLAQMGQVPLSPPNVKGWPGGRMWINTSTLFARHNATLRFAVQPARVWDSPEMAAPTPSGVVDRWLGRLIQRPVAEAKRNVLVETLDQKKPGDLQGVRRVVELIVTMPEYQLC